VYRLQQKFLCYNKIMKNRGMFFLNTGFFRGHIINFFLFLLFSLNYTETQHMDSQHINEYSTNLKYNQNINDLRQLKNQKYNTTFNEYKKDNTKRYYNFKDLLHNLQIVQSWMFHILSFLELPYFLFFFFVLFKNIVSIINLNIKDSNIILLYSYLRKIREFFNYNQQNQPQLEDVLNIDINNSKKTQVYTFLNSRLVQVLFFWVFLRNIFYKSSIGLFGFVFFLILEKTLININNQVSFLKDNNVIEIKTLFEVLFIIFLFKTIIKIIIFFATIFIGDKKLKTTLLKLICIPNIFYLVFFIFYYYLIRFLMEKVGKVIIDEKISEKSFVDALKIIKNNMKDLFFSDCKLINDFFVNPKIYFNTLYFFYYKIIFDFKEDDIRVRDENLQI